LEDPMDDIEKLCQAVQRGDAVTCEECLKLDPKLIHEFYDDGMQPLHFAAQSNRAELIAFLLDRGAEIDALGGEDSRTPLHYAADMSPAAARILIDRGADLNPVDFRGFTPLCFAIAEQTRQGAEVAKMLRDAGAEYGLTEAAAMGDFERVQGIFASDPNTLVQVPSKELLLNLLLNVGNYGTIPDRERILKFLFDHGLEYPKDYLLKTAKSWEVSNVGKLGKMLRQQAKKAKS